MYWTFVILTKADLFLVMKIDSETCPILHFTSSLTWRCLDKSINSITKDKWMI